MRNADDRLHAVVRGAWLVSFVGGLIMFLTGTLAGAVLQFLCTKHGN